MWKLLLAILALAVALPAAAAPASAARKWVELTARGPQLRAVAPDGVCPEASLDGRTLRMHRREGPSAAFPITVCQLLVPHGVRRAAIGDWSAPLLDQAPWVFARGNHEACSRGGPGWFRLLDQAPQPSVCPSQSAPFRVRMGDTSLYVLDSADTDDTTAPAGLVKAFARQLDVFGSELDSGKGWIVTHRPVWGLTPVARLGPLGPVEVGLNKTEQAAVRGRKLSGVQMIVSGHIHHFAAYDFGAQRPAQLVAGTGGDVGEPADSPKILAGLTSIDDMQAQGFAFERYGYLLLERHGSDWTGDFRDLDDKAVASCRLHGRDLTCRRTGG